MHAEVESVNTGGKGEREREDEGGTGLWKGREEIKTSR